MGTETDAEDFEALDLLPSESAVVPFEVGEAMEWEHTPEIDLRKCHQVFEE